MYDRYDLEISDEIFNFLILQTKNKKVNFYVSIFINELPQFALYKDKREYVMSIPNIAPKDKSRGTFYRVINDNIDIIPNQLKMEIIKIFENYIDKSNLHPYTVTQYLELIQRLKEK